MDFDLTKPPTPDDSPTPRPAKTVFLAVLWCVGAICLFALNAVSSTS